VIAVDTNLLVYAHRSDSPSHAAARRVIETLRESPAPWAIAWPCVHEFLAVVTHPRIFKDPTPLAAAFAAADAWGAGGNLHLIGEGEGYLDKLRRQATVARVAGPRVHDARIMALCLHHGVRELWSADRDFTRFTGLTVRNPLAAPSRD
jgi:hypothetical protein